MRKIIIITIAAVIFWIGTKMGHKASLPQRVVYVQENITNNAAYVESRMPAFETGFWLGNVMQIKYGHSATPDQMLQAARQAYWYSMTN